MKSQTFIAENISPMRLDKILVEFLPELTRSAIEKLIENGAVTVGGKMALKSLKVKQGEAITIQMPDLAPLDALPQDIPLDIVFEDDDLIVVNKPKGMVVHPAAGNYEGTLVNALLYHCKSSLSGINGIQRPGIVHRIDKDTSGLLIVAKNDFAHNKLAAQIKAHTFTREYEGVVCGIVKNDTGTIDAPIGRHPVKRKQMAVTEKNSKNAITHYKVLERLKGYTYLNFKLETGRTHQIRVHMAYLGYPFAGDSVYGKGKAFSSIEGQCLHAKKIGFIHPRGGYLEFEAETPLYFKNLLRSIR